MIFGLEPTENSWHRYSRFCIRNQAHLADAQSSREKREWWDGRECEVKKIGNDSRKIIRKRRPRERGQKLLTPRAVRSFSKLPDECSRYLIRRKMRTPRYHLYLRKRGFRNPSGLATLFDLKFPAHLAACVHRFSMPTTRKFPPRQTRRCSRKYEGSHLFASAEQLITENLHSGISWTILRTKNEEIR